MGLEDVVGIRLKGANFEDDTDLQLFYGKENCGLGLLYGKNGAGKSTISRGFAHVSGKEEETIENAELIDKDKNALTLSEEDKQSIFVFNEDYVDLNIKLNTDATGLETIVVLGKKVGLQKQLDDALDKFKKADDEYIQKKVDNEKYANEKKEESPLFWKKAINVKLKEKDGWAQRDSKIKGNTRASSVGSDTYKNIISSKPTKTEIELRNEFASKVKDLDDARSGKKKIEIPVKCEVSIIADEELLRKLLSKKIEEPVLSDREKYLLELQKENGLSHIENIKMTFGKPDLDKCPLCLQEVSQNYKDELFSSIEKILSKEAEKHAEDLKALYISDVDYDTSEYSELSKEVAEVKDALTILKDCIADWNKNIERKINDVYSPITEVKVDIQKAVEDYQQKLNALENARLEYNKDVMDTKALETELAQTNNDIAYFEIKSLSDELSKRERAQDNDIVALRKLEDNRNACGKAVEAIQATKRDIKIALNDINEGLSYIFFSKNRLSIEAYGDEYILKSRGKNVTPSRISVGERNAIALCYFFSDLMRNKEEDEIYSSQYLLVIDDPISSFDKDNRIGIISYLRREVSRFVSGNPKTKFLIMSHDIQTAFDVEKIYKEIMGNGLKDVKDDKYYVSEIRNNQTCKFSLSSRNEYSILLQQIYKYAKEENDSFDLSVGNAMRRVLEAYGTFNYKKGIAQLSTIPDICGKLKDRASYFETLMYRIVLNGESHSAERIVTIDGSDFFANLSREEKIRTAREVISFLYLLDDYHVKEHLKDLKETDIDTVINGWIGDITSIDITA